MAKERVIVLASGGLNSAVITSLAACDAELAMLHVRWGHRADEREFEYFGQVAERYDAKHRLVVELPHFTTIGGNARISRKRQIEDVLALTDGESNCYAPGLIGTLVNTAVTWAVTIQAQRIYLGVSENLGPPGPRTASVFPDYSRQNIQLLQHMLLTSLPNRKISLETPLLELKRSDIVRLGNRLKAPFEFSWSCLSSGAKPCGGCLGCATRNRGFLDAGVPDPLLLPPPPQPGKPRAEPIKA